MGNAEIFHGHVEFYLISIIIYIIYICNTYNYVHADFEFIWSVSEYLSTRYGFGDSWDYIYQSDMPSIAKRRNHSIRHYCMLLQIIQISGQTVNFLDNFLLNYVEFQHVTEFGENFMTVISFNKSHVPLSLLLELSCNVVLKNVDFSLLNFALESWIIGAIMLISIDASNTSSTSNKCDGWL